MIQEIFPNILDNQFHNLKITAKDTVLLFKGNTVLAKKNGNELVYPDYEEFAESGRKDKDVYDYIYLLSVDEERYFLALEKNMSVKGRFAGEMADSSIHTEYETNIEGYEFFGVNIFRNALPKYRAFAVITAYHLYGWYRDNRVCGRCGNKLEHSDKERMVYCKECGNTVYPKICPAVIVGVTNKDKLLLTKYANRTYSNYALVAGFAEIGETIEETVAREVYEEVGLKVKNIQYYKSQPWGLSGSLLFGFYCELDGDDTITLEEDELSIGEWVKAKDILTDNDGVSLTREMIVKFAKEHR